VAKIEYFNKKGALVMAEENAGTICYGEIFRSAKIFQLNKPI
jgi:hypothetical protein